MAGFQYKIVSVTRERVEEVLNDNGQHGWELCSALPEGEGPNMTIHLFFKTIGQ